MSDRLYYNDSFLYEFDARVVDAQELRRDGSQAVWALKLDRTAFYPTSGGQPFDIGRLRTESKSGIPLEVAVEEVFEDDAGEVWHRVNKVLPPGAEVRASIDVERRRDHMQQHTGQHLLSAAFIELLGAKTVSFHLGEEISTIDLEVASISRDDLVRVERRANEIIAEDRDIQVRYVASLEEARALGVRKLPEREGQIRLIDMQDYDLNACGGTHASSTGQIGGLLIRRTEKVKQGTRVEFVCGLRAARTARRDFELLAQSAGLYPCAPADLPANISKQRDELRTAQKRDMRLLEEIADFQARELVAQTPFDAKGVRVISRVFHDRDAAFAKVLGQRLVRENARVVALLASSESTPSLVFARSSDVAVDVGTLLRELVGSVGGKGGGGKDFAQGGVSDTKQIEPLLQQATERIAELVP